MGFQVTRQDIRARVLREAHRRTDSATVAAESINAFIQDGYGEWYYQIGADGRAALGRAHRSIAIDNDRSTIDLPGEFLALEGWSRLDSGGRRDALPPQLVRQEVALQSGWLDDAAGTPCYPETRTHYYLEGPGQEFDEGLQQLVTFGLRLRAFPPFKAGQTVTIVYRTQPLYLGDPAVLDVGVDLAPIELLAPPNYQALVGIVRVRSAARGDVSEVQRATAALATAARATVAAIAREDRSGVIGADQYIDGTRGVVGYGS